MQLNLSYIHTKKDNKGAHYLDFIYKNSELP